jgi:CheY-like chemotaxis protein
VNKELRILILEDDSGDVVLINRELRQRGLAFRSIRVETRADFIRELQENPPDLIFSDHGLPVFDGFAALALAREKCPEIPFIFVTGSEREELALETFKSGATDLVLKGRMSNLAPAVQRALQLVEERERRKAAEQALQKSQESYQQLVELCPDALFVQSDNLIVFANSAAARLLGAGSVEQLIGKPLREIVHPAHWEMMQRRLRQLREEGTTFFWKSAQGRMQRLDEDAVAVPFIDEQFVRLDGKVVDVEVAAAPLTFQERPAVQIIARDITQRRRSAE